MRDKNSSFARTLSMEWLYPRLASRMHVGQRIKTLRTIKEMSQDDYAERVGLTRSQLSNFELGKRWPNPEAIARICEFSSATADYLLFGRSSTLPADLFERIRSIQESTDEPDK